MGTGWDMLLNRFSFLSAQFLMTLERIANPRKEISDDAFKKVWPKRKVLHALCCASVHETKGHDLLTLQL